MQLYIYLNGAKRGPFSEEQILRMLSEGALNESDLASANLDGEWQPIGSCVTRSPAAVQALGEYGPPAETDQLRASHDSLGSYARATISENETVFDKTSVHWIVFVRFAVLALLVFFFVAIPFALAVQALIALRIGWLVLPLPILILIPPAVQFASSEVVVTNRRVLIKTGVIHRQTLEMFISRVESVGVDQSFLGRMLDYGTVIIRGTGGSEEPFQTIAHPIAFRNAVQRLQSEDLTAEKSA